MLKRKNILLLGILILLIFTLTASSYSATVTVSPGTNLAQVIEDANQGDTIVVNSGNYAWAATSANPSITTFWINKPLSLIAADPNNPPTLTVPASSNTVIMVSGNNVTIDGFNLHAPNGADYGIFVYDYQNANGGTLSGINIKNNITNTDTSSGANGHGIFFQNVNNSTIDSNVITTAKDNGIYILRCNDVLVLNNHVQNTIRQHAIGIQESNVVYVLDNTITGSAYHGIILLETHNSRIERNNISGCRYDGITLTDRDTNKGVGCSFNYIGQNNASSTSPITDGNTGVWLNSNSNGNFVYLNSLSGFTENGHSIWASSNNQSIGNTISNNLQGGIFVWNAFGQTFTTGSTPANNVIHNNAVWDSPANGLIHLKGCQSTQVGYNFLSAPSSGQNVAAIKVGHRGDSSAGVSGVSIYENTEKDIAIGDMVFENVSGASIFRNRHINVTNTFCFAGASVQWDAGSFVGGNYWSNFLAQGNPSQATPYSDIIYDDVGNRGQYADGFPFQSENLGESYSVVVHEPYAGVVAAAGSVKTIRWQSVGSVYVDITYSSSAGSGTIVTNYPDIGYYKWTIPSSIASANDYQVQVHCKNSALTGVTSGSGQAFSIAGGGLKLAFPGRNFLGTAGAHLRVSWIKHSSVGSVDVYLKYNSGAYQHIASSTGTFVGITLPDGISSNSASVKVVDSANNNNQDSTDGFFRLGGHAGSVSSILASNGGDALTSGNVAIGDTYIVEWLSPNNSKYVDIYFWNGSALVAAVANLPDFGRFRWLIREYPTDSSYIIIDFKNSAGNSLGNASSKQFGIAYSAEAPSPTPTPACTDGLTPVYRLYSEDLMVHLYTTDENEKNVLGAGPVWHYETIAWYVYPTAQSGTVPVYRLYSDSLKIHLYTTDENEKNVLGAGPIWNYEKIAWYVYPTSQSGTVPVYRLYSDILKKHLYTRDENEKNVLDAGPVWSYETVAYYAYEMCN